MIHPMDVFMSLLKKHWRFTLPITVVVLCLIVSTLTLYGTDKPKEPKIVYAIPEQSSNEPPAINTGGARCPAYVESKRYNTDIICTVIQEKWY